MLNSKIELLAPAGDYEKLKIAIKYGADAVYFGGEMFSLRAGAGNLSLDEIRNAMELLHSCDRKGYLTINIYPHNDDIDDLKDYLERLKEIPIDAFLISDPGVMGLVKEFIPNAEIHLSTQANTTNYLSASFWAKQGVKRIVAAREMSLNELKEMRKHLPNNIEIESFVHGAMCISYSGRCLLSNFMTGRDANKGACSHPCRWKYSIVEEQRPNEYYPIEEDEHGSYIMNSRDLCMLDSIPDLINAGVVSLKIEGRMKSAYYIATVISAYRKAIDSYLENPAEYIYQKKWFEHLCKASHREFTHGFYYEKPGAGDHNYDTSDYIRGYSFIGIVKDFNPDTMIATVEQRNKFSVGDTIEIFGPDTEYFEMTVSNIWDEKGNDIKSAPHPQEIIKLKVDKPVAKDYMLRMKLLKQDEGSES